MRPAASVVAKEGTSAGNSSKNGQFIRSSKTDNSSDHQLS